MFQIYSPPPARPRTRRRAPGPSGEGAWAEARAQLAASHGRACSEICFGRGTRGRGRGTPERRAPRLHCNGPEGPRLKRRFGGGLGPAARRARPLARRAKRRGARLEKGANAGAASPPRLAPPALSPTPLRDAPAHRVRARRGPASPRGPARSIGVGADRRTPGKLPMQKTVGFRRLWKRTLQRPGKEIIQTPH